MESPTSSTSATVVTRRPVGFIDGDDTGLASVAEISRHQHQNNYSRTCGAGINRKSSLRNISIASSISSGTTTVASPRNNRFYIDARFEEMNHQPYFLEACYLCRKPLGGNRDIFMYRGDTPFCSEECRQEQIEIDECKEKNNISAKMKALRNKNKESQKSAASSSSSTKNYPYRATGTTVAAA